MYTPANLQPGARSCIYGMELDNHDIILEVDQHAGIVTAVVGY